MSDITRYPLHWPNNVPRRAPHQRGHPHFGDTTIHAATQLVLQEINRLNKRHWNHSDSSVIISTNQKLRLDGLPVSNGAMVADGAVAVYFKLYFQRTGKWFNRPCVLTCDKWLKIQDNLKAIAKDIEAQRARERWGCTSVEQAFQGYLCIPEKTGGKAWWDILEVPTNATRDMIAEAYRAKAKDAHPDSGGSFTDFTKLKDAFDQAMAQFSS